MNLTLSVLKNTLAIVRLDSNAAIPTWLTMDESSFVSITKTADELSIVCDQSIVPANLEKCVKDWRAFKVEGPLDFSLTGILASLTQPLAAHKISIFAISTYDTDYLLVKEKDLKSAIEVLKKDCTIKTD